MSSCGQVEGPWKTPSRVLVRAGGAVLCGGDRSSPRKTEDDAWDRTDPWKRAAAMTTALALFSLLAGCEESPNQYPESEPTMACPAVPHDGGGRDAVVAAFTDLGLGGDVQTDDNGNAVRFGAAVGDGGCITGYVGYDGSVMVDFGGTIKDGGCLAMSGH